MAKFKVVIGTDHVGIQYVDELIDTFPEIDFIAAYDPIEHKEAIRDADVFFGWPDDQAFSAARQLKWKFPTPARIRCTSPLSSP